MSKPTGGHRTITLREERRGADSRRLWAYLDTGGNLHIDGQDIGPATSLVSGDGEYEWFKTIRAADIPALIELLEGTPGENILSLLARKYTGSGAAELERRLREGNVPVELHVWSG